MTEVTGTKGMGVRGKWVEVRGKRVKVIIRGSRVTSMVLIRVTKNWVGWCVLIAVKWVIQTKNVTKLPRLVGFLEKNSEKYWKTYGKSDRREIGTAHSKCGPSKYH